MTTIVDEVAHEPSGAAVLDEGPGQSTSVRARVGSELGWLLGGLIVLLAFRMGVGPLHDNSFLTHLATGRLILSEGGVPRADPYSFTASGEPWVVQSWMASVVYATTERVAGLGGIRVLNGALYAAIGTCLWLLSARARSGAVRFGVTAVVLGVASQFLYGRPLLFGLIGLLLVFLAAEERLDPRWLVPVGWLWVNTHGSFPFALVLVAALAVGRRLDDGAWGPELRVGAWAAMGIAVGVLNPLGLDVITFSASLVSKREAFAAILEWQAPTYDDPAQYAVLGGLLLAACLLVRRPRWRDALPLVVFGALGLTSLRNQVVLLCVLVPILVGSLPQVGPDASLRRPYLGAVRVVALILALGAVLALPTLRDRPVGLGGYPEQATVWMEEQGLWGAESRVLAPDYVGNLRTAQAGRDARVFIDDRVDMYPIELIRDYGDLWAAEPNWPEILDEHGITAILWEEDTPLGGALQRDEGWEPVHRDAPWVVWARVSSP